MVNALLLLILISTEQFSLPPQLPPRNFAPSESKDFHAEPVKMIEQSRVSIVDTYLQRLQLVDMSQYYMIYTISDLCHNTLYYFMILTIKLVYVCYIKCSIMSINTFRYDLCHDWLSDHMPIYLWPYSPKTSHSDTCEDVWLVLARKNALTF